MESRSYIVIGLIAWASIFPCSAKHSLQEKQDVALEQVIKADDTNFVHQLKKAMRLNSKYIKKLKKRQNADVSILLEKAIAYDDQIHSKNASRDAIISSLKEQNAVLRVIDQRIRLEPVEKFPSDGTDLSPSPISGKLSVGQTDHSPAKQLKQTDYVEPTLTIPMDIGNRVGIDKLIEEK
jgi:hypothetical protein